MMHARFQGLKLITFPFCVGLKDYGRDWEAIARRVMTKTGAQCKNFYFNYKKKLQLELLVLEHERTKVISSLFLNKPSRDN